MVINIVTKLDYESKQPKASPPAGLLNYGRLGDEVLRDVWVAIGKEEMNSSVASTPQCESLDFN